MRNKLLEFLIKVDLFLTILIDKYDRYTVNLFLGADQALNTILGGHPDETISSRLGRSIGRERYFWVKWLRVSVDFVANLFGDPNHCYNSIMPLEQQNMKIWDYEVWSWNKKE